MDPLTLALIGGGIGLLQGQEKKKEAIANRKLAAATAALSPWTGMQAETSFSGGGDLATLGGAAQGALSGAALGQSMQSAKATEGLNKTIAENTAAQTKLMGAQTKALTGAGQKAAASAMPMAMPAQTMPPMQMQQSVMPKDMGYLAEMQPQMSPWAYQPTQQMSPAYAKNWGY